MKHARSTALLCALVIAGCYAPEVPDCAAPCGTGNSCPASTVCSVGRCARPGTRCPPPPPPDGGPPDLRPLSPRPDLGTREPDARARDEVSPPPPAPSRAPIPSASGSDSPRGS